jgi:ubiquinone/menaquinone biosynthesis C-methylase UbiE
MMRHLTTCMKKYINITELKKEYARGSNIIATINQKYGFDNNSIEAIETSYDLQAGSYISYFEKSKDFSNKYASEQAHHILTHFPSGTGILDCGCGELTNTALLFSKLKGYTGYSCFDLSWSRVLLGKEFFCKKVSNELCDNTDIFVADMSDIPLPDNAIDVLMTSHALEPNHGREQELLTELLRVARLGLVLFEPSYELGLDEQKIRMRTHGYVRDLPQIIAATEHETFKAELLENYSNPLNRTAVYVVKKKRPAPLVTKELVDPISKTQLVREGSFYFSQQRGVLYPIVRDIPVLRESVQILATAFEKND